MSAPRMYADLARWWPLLSPPEEYVEEAAMIRGLLQASPRPVRTLLELGSGGGHNAVHLRTAYEMTLVDLAEPMLTLSRARNPDCAHVTADMRAVRLDRTFDAVLLHDAVDYMLTEQDLSAVFATAAAHLDAGGVLVVVPDHVRERFATSTDHGGTDAPDGSGIRYLQWTYDPDPADDWVVSEFGYLIRDVDGTLTSAAETHHFGLFAQERWVALLNGAGFEVTTLIEQTEEERPGRLVFVGTRTAPTAP